MHVPELHELEELRRYAEGILKPEVGQKVIIMVVDDDEEALDNVVPIFGGPLLTGEADRQQERAATVQMLLELAELAEKGEIRGAAVICGMESNERFMSGVETAFTPGVIEHLAMFTGGCTLLQQHINDAFMDASDPGYE